MCRIRSVSYHWHFPLCTLLQVSHNNPHFPNSYSLQHLPPSSVRTPVQCPRPRQGLLPTLAVDSHLMFPILKTQSLGQPGHCETAVTLCVTKTKLWTNQYRGNLQQSSWRMAISPVVTVNRLWFSCLFCRVLQFSCLSFFRALDSSVDKIKAFGIASYYLHFTMEDIKASKNKSDLQSHTLYNQK